jgi:hypothetical protein
MARQSKKMASNLGQVLKNHQERSLERLEEEDRVADNIHHSATLEIGATSQTLSLYSDI